MNILSLAEYQKDKSAKKIIDTSLSDYKLAARKHLELQVKLSFLAQETSRYKYWIDNKSQLNHDVIFEKYIDFLAHVINLGLYKNYLSSYELNLKPSDYCLSDQFLNLFIDINDLIISPSTDHFNTLLEDVLSLGVSLGYDEEQINKAFE